MTVPTGLGAVLALIVLVVVIVLLVVHELPLTIGLLLAGLALARLT